jgi:hypothetical protein
LPLPDSSLAFVESDVHPAPPIQVELY